MNPEEIGNQQLIQEESESESPEQEIQKPSEEELNKFFNQLLEYNSNIYSPVHDLNNQLTVILGCSQLLNNSDTCPTELKTLSKEIDTSSEDCATLNYSLLNILKEAVRKEKILKNEETDWMELDQDTKKEILDSIKKMEKVPEITNYIVKETKSLKEKSDLLKDMASTLNFENAEEKDFVDVITNSGKILKHLIKKIERKKGHSEETVVADINDLLTAEQKDLLMLANYRLGNKCELKLNMAETARIKTNLDELTTCLENMVINSSQVFEQNRKKDGKIIISTGKFLDENNQLFTTITFQDNGTGMTEEQLEKFNNQKNLETTKTNGNGQGLKEIQSYIQNLGGYVKAINLPEGGLELTLFIPAIEEEQKMQESKVLESVA